MWLISLAHATIFQISIIDIFSFIGIVIVTLSTWDGLLVTFNMCVGLMSPLPPNYWPYASKIVSVSHVTSLMDDIHKISNLGCTISSWSIVFYISIPIKNPMRNCYSLLNLLSRSKSIFFIIAEINVLV